MRLIGQELRGWTKIYESEKSPLQFARMEWSVPFTVYCLQPSLPLLAAVQHSLGDRSVQTHAVAEGSDKAVIRVWRN